LGGHYGLYFVFINLKKINKIMEELKNNFISSLTTEEIINNCPESKPELREAWFKGVIWLKEQLELNDNFIRVSEKTPPENIELLAKSPTGDIHLTSWRSSYNIFGCQEKTASSYDWSWKTI
jgi:hypothetical protein